VSPTKRSASAPSAKRSARIGYLDFVAEPPANVPSLVVVAGKEHLLADEVIQRVIAIAVPDESLRALNVDAIDARATTDFGPIAEKTATLPFLAARRAVVVRGTIDLKKEEREAIVEAAASVPDSAVLVIDHAGKPARPQGRKPMDEAAAFAKALPGSLLVDCTLNAAGCVKYIEMCAGELGVQVDPGAVTALASIESATEIRNVLDRLALSLKRIRLDDVREYARSSSDVKYWDLGGAVNAGDTARALKLAREIVSAPGDAMGPLIWLAADAQIVWELRSGSRADAYAAATGQNFWRIKNMLGACRDLSPKELKERVDVTMMALHRSLTGRRQADQALEEVIVRLTSKK
jgi:DNA polymerase III delta subunit